MTTFTRNENELVVNELTHALLYFSKGTMTPIEAEGLSRSTLADVDYQNPALAHKGVNWLAKEVLKKEKVRHN